MNLTPDEQSALMSGDTVDFTVQGKQFVILSRERYEHIRRFHDSSDYDASGWTDDEMDLLAAEDADRLGWSGMDVYQDEK
jgi:hypothetical protein